MDNSIMVEVAEKFAMCLYALPVVMLGMWLSTKRWLFYPVAVVGFVWMAYVIFGCATEVLANPEVATSVKVMTWSIPPVFFVVLNVGAIASIQGMRRQAVERDTIEKELDVRKV